MVAYVKRTMGAEGGGGGGSHPRIGSDVQRIYFMQFLSFVFV